MRQYDLVNESPVADAVDMVADYIRDPFLKPGWRKAAHVCAFLAARDALPKDMTYEWAMEHYKDVVEMVTNDAAARFSEVKRGLRRHGGDS